MSDEPSAVETVKKEEAKPPTRGDRFLAWLTDNWRPCAMVVLVIAGYLVKKFVKVSDDEAELLEGLWLALGLGAVFTPSFKRKPKDPA